MTAVDVLAAWDRQIEWLRDLVATNPGSECHTEELEEAIQARAAVAELMEAAREAEQDDGGTRYDSEEDEIGTRACCYVLSYKDHEPDCYISKLRSALARCGK